uniref:Putative secreted protein n=1 Tax=Anopheles darlingi TaxID=43151 RepID=A0A2M4DFT1_ANODA
MSLPAVAALMQHMTAAWAHCDAILPFLSPKSVRTTSTIFSGSSRRAAAASSVRKALISPRTLPAACPCSLACTL